MNKSETSIFAVFYQTCLKTLSLGHTLIKAACVFVAALGIYEASSPRDIAALQTINLTSFLYPSSFNNAAQKSKKKSKQS